MRGEKNIAGNLQLKVKDQAYKPGASWCHCADTFRRMPNTKDKKSGEKQTSDHKSTWMKTDLKSIKLGGFQLKEQFHCKSFEVRLELLAVKSSIADFPSGLMICYHDDMLPLHTERLHRDTGK